MGVQELMYVVGALVLLGALIYGVSKSGRRPQSKASEDATDRLYDRDPHTNQPLPKSMQRDEPHDDRSPMEKSGEGQPKPR